MNNGEILYLYDAKMSNPNGNPDDENRPRMDYARDVNLVTDLRLKRYVRDYFLMQGKELYVQFIEGKPVTSEARVKNYSKKTGIDYDKLLEDFIDIRLFGATVTAKKDNRSFTGPVQFNWGYSLNSVEIIDAGITSHFSTGEAKKQGAMGRDYRVQYSLLAFSGTISAKRAETTKLMDEDIDALDEAMIKAIPLLATRSKIGQFPRLYLRLEFKNDQTMLKDLRSYLKLESTHQEIRNIDEYTVEVGDLKEYLNKEKDKIDKINYFIDGDLKLTVNGEITKPEKLLDGFKTVDLGEKY